MDLSNKRIILCKTNRIGDVVVSLPVAAILKKMAPTCHITMIVTEYTKMLPQHFPAVDAVIAWDSPSVKSDPVGTLKNLQTDIIIHLRAKKDIVKAAKKAGISVRIGASNRWYNWLYCNQRYKVTRTRYSPLHDAQLDMQLILPLIKKPLPTREEMAECLLFSRFDNPTASTLLDPNKFNLILHPKSVTDAGKREWPLKNFAKVIELLDAKPFKIFITGTEADGKAVRSALCAPFSQVTDLTGKLTLEALTQFIQSADGFIGGSTGPLHIAAAMGIHALGLYTPTAGHQPSRWGPLGKKAEYLITKNNQCRACKKHQACPCINDITPEQVVTRVLTWRYETR